MSLKAFHLVFVVTSVVLLAILTGWAVANFRESGERVYLVWTALFSASGVGLLAYARYFVRKLKHISYL